jgi:hypothetical protein
LGTWAGRDEGTARAYLSGRLPRKNDPDQMEGKTPLAVVSHVNERGSEARFDERIEWPIPQ